eukprot:3115199-Rhodomonas_salina.1
MDSSYEVNEVGFVNGMSIEGSFVASLLPQRTGPTKCQCPQASPQPVSDVHVSGHPQPTQEGGVARFSEAELDLVTNPGPFMRVMLLDDDYHTLDYAMETIEDVLKTTGVASHQHTVRKERVQWTAFQAHFYGMGTVAVLPEAAAGKAAAQLRNAGLGCKVVWD